MAARSPADHRGAEQLGQHRVLFILGQGPHRLEQQPHQLWLPDPCVRERVLAWFRDRLSEPRR
jgi:hypothetical protein